MINNNFSNYISSFPEDIARDIQVLQAMDEDIRNALNEDFKNLRTNLTKNRIPHKFDISKSNDYDYLFYYSLYTRNEIQSNSQEIAFCLSNLYQCKMVIEN